MGIQQAFADLFVDAGGGAGEPRAVDSNSVSCLPHALGGDQQQTAQAFSDKWDQFAHGSPAFEKMVANQKAWYLDLYGFSTEAALAAFLHECRTVLDAGAGMAYKAAWFAELNPAALVVAADISSSLHQAAAYYRNLRNLVFVQCDIGDMPFFRDGVFDYVSCDQVLHHTADPSKTFQELVRLTAPGKVLAAYVYRKKAVPRELVDDFFRDFSKSLNHEQLMELSRQITELGRVLSAVDGEIDVPPVPLLGIQGGRMSVQRFIYWNFLKCYWNEDLGYENSLMTNYDWYAPSQAFRYSEEEFRSWINREGLAIEHFHKELACLSGRFRKPPGGGA